MTKHKIQILDCTLRDGSYAIDYQFTAEDTAVIVAGLESAGFELIEIGHGLGMGASTRDLGVAAATDEEYMVVAKNTLKKAQYGMFCIPGIATLSDVDLAGKHKMGFLRVGTNVNEVERAESFIKRGKELGMTISCNLMKSYALPPKGFAESVRRAYKYGADIICVVDSAGGMLPQDVIEYVAIVRNETGAQIGFHGHDNLCMAATNSIEAVKAGATIVDTSLQGMGRSAGNAQSAILAILLEKMGYRTGIDIYKTLDLGDKMIKSMVGGEKGVDSIAAILGSEQFHSSYLKLVEKIAKKYDLDVREVITGVSKVDRIKVSEELVERVAKKLKPVKSRFGAMHVDFDVTGIVKKHNSKDVKDIAAEIASEMVTLSKKTGRKTVFTIAQTSNKSKQFTSFPFIRNNANYIVGNAEVVSLKDALAIIESIDGIVDFLLIDNPLFNQLRRRAEDLKSVVLPYNDDDAQADSLWKIVNRQIDKESYAVVLTGENYMTHKLVLKFLSHGHKVVSDWAYANRALFNGAGMVVAPVEPKTVKAADVVIGLTPFVASVTPELLENARKDVFVIDGGPQSLSPAAVEYAHAKKLKVYRLEMRAGLFGEIEAVIGTHYLKNNIIGEGVIDGVRVVSGGVIGKRGDVVVDSITTPGRIIGIADGSGSLMRDEDAKKYESQVKKVRLAIAKSIFA